MREIDIEDLERKGHEMMSKAFAKPTKEDLNKLKPLVLEILSSNDVLTKIQLLQLKRKHKFTGKNSFLFSIYLQLLASNEVSNNNEDILRKSLMIKACKSWSGITSITVFTSPYPEYTNDKGEKVRQEFTCRWNCHFCAKQDGQPRSYILNEPGVLRANRNNFDCVSQMHDRMNSLYMIGHGNLGKLEILVLGGTFASYPNPYREEFTRDIYYAANVFWERNSEDPRPRLSLSEEKKINKTAMCRVIGLTFETRGDSIDADELIFLRKLGCTRIQMGIQHIDDDVLDANNRKCKHKRTVEAIQMLKKNCWKIDGHFMPNLPFSTIEKDRNMLINHLAGTKSPVKHKVIYNNWLSWWNKEPEYWEYYDIYDEDIQVDQIKIYPTAVTVYTEIEKWYKSGKYVPYAESLLFDLLLDFKSLVFPWIRINRIVRDFFADTIYSESGSNLSMREQLEKTMKQNGTRCACIRCREVKDNISVDWNGSYIIVIREYRSSGAYEYFISAESSDFKTLYGFVRLRLDDGKNKVFSELNDAALIRELHVYSQLTNVGTKGSHVQHKGIGTKLMQKAEKVAWNKGYKKIAIISGIGAQTFYEKIGYKEYPGDGEFMIKFKQAQSEK
jgi:histone acetyltransferase (RNA polymerase elongator complex component)